MVETLEQVRLRDPVAPRQLQPGVPRDLETICLKCLEKEPARRYATAEALADDLRRCLRGEPIHARPGTLWNRAGKWMKRRPAVTGLLAALVAVIATAFAAVLWQLGETGDALEQAEADASARRVALARFHYGAYEVAKARELLLQCPPRFRDAEWRQAQRAVFAEQHCLRPGVVVRKVFWSTDGRRVIGCSMDGRIFGWDAGTGKPVYEHRWRAPTEPPASQFALSSDGKTLFCLQQRYLARGSRIHVECIRLRDGKTTAAHEFTNSTTGHAAVSRNGRLALHGRDGHARFTTVTDLDSGEEVLKLTHKGRWDARWLQFSPDGTRLVRMVASREITIFDVATGRRVLALTPKSPFRPRAFFDPGGRYVAFGFFAQPAGNVLNLQVFDTESGKRIRSIDCPNVLGALIADIASDPKRIAWTGERSSLNIGNIGPVVVRSAKVPLLAEQETQRRAEQRNQRRAERKAAKVDVDLPLRGHTAAMTDLAFSPDGNRLASCNQDGTVRIWDVRPLE
jgi:hypothetical protein